VVIVRFDPSRQLHWVEILHTSNSLLCHMDPFYIQDTYYLLKAET
jgi:hypothetical protein